MSMNTFIIRKPNKPYCLKVVEALGGTELALESVFAGTRGSGMVTWGITLGQVKEEEGAKEPEKNGQRRRRRLGQL